MVISIMFKDKNKVFKGKTYDFILNKEETIPEKGSIIHLMTSNYDYKFYGTRVKVVDVKETSQTATEEVRFILSSLED